MQIHASAAGALPPGPSALPPGLLPGPTGAANPGVAAAAAAGLPTSIALLAGIPSSLAQAGPHPAFASLLAQQKPSLDPSIRPSVAAVAAAAVAAGKDEELKRAIAETNGRPPSHPILPTNLQPDERQVS